MIEARKIEYYEERLAEDVWNEEKADRNKNQPTYPYNLVPRYKDDLIDVEYVK